MQDPETSAQLQAQPPSQVLNIPAGQNFMRTLAQGLLQEYAARPLELADVEIFVPDQDSVKNLRRALVDASQSRAVFLPRIAVPGDEDTADLALRLSSQPMLAQSLKDVPQPVTRLERQLILAAEIMKIPGMASSLEKAVALGYELGRFLDEAQTQRISLDKLSSLVAPDFKKQWAPTEQFLKIIAEIWPQKLKDMGRTDPEAHRLLLLQAQAAAWQQTPPQKPVILAGFTHTTPALQDFMAAALLSQKTQLLLPGFDPQLDAASWQSMTPVHPQYAFKKLLQSLGKTVAEVSVWSGTPEETLPRRARAKILREAMRPAGASAGWSRLKSRKTVRKGMADKDNVIDAVAVKNMDMMTTGSAQEEASVIALKLRQILEKPDQTVAVVTADRSLARRIVARLKHWQIDVEDGAGQSLAETSVGIFLLSSAQMAAQRLAPVPLLEALKHPLSALKRDAETMRLNVQALEDAALHGPRPAPDAEGLKESLSNIFNRVAKRPSGADEKLLQNIIRANVLVQDLQQAGSVFLTDMAADEKIPFSFLLESHLQFAEQLADDGKGGAARLWAGRDGAAAAYFMTELKARAALLPAVAGRDYADVLTGLLRAVHVRADQNRHTRIRILTPEQAALHPSDITIVAGLNDEVWPAPVRHNPWLSPEMSEQLGLPSSHESIGHAAHYFVQALSGENVTLSRATRTGSAPAAASPFLTRFLMVLKGSGLSKALLQPKDPLIEINAALHAPDAVQPILPPAPCPAVELRPKQLPVTAIENLMRDPYSVYAKYVLNLRPKSALDSPPSVREKGIFTHEALDTFVKKYPDKLPENAEQELLKIGAETFKTRMNSPAVQAFWWPRFERIAKWFVKFETDRRELSHTLATEVRGSLTFDLGDGETFTLTAIVDRIDANEDGEMSIIDYKTGGVPAQKDVALGLSPQLTLEAAIALSGGFEKVKPGSEVAELQYWKLSGGRPAAEVTDVKGEPADLAKAAKDGLAQLIKAFNDRATPYLPTPKPDDAPRYNAYAHLARTGEWSMVTKTQAALPAPEQNNGKKNKKKQGGKPS